MESVVEKLQHVGLTEYEARVYLALLNTHLSTATQASERSGVPRKNLFGVGIAWQFRMHDRFIRRRLALCPKIVGRLHSFLFYCVLAIRFASSKI